MSPFTFTCVAIACMLFPLRLFAQPSDRTTLYDPSRDAVADVAQSVAQAKAEGKHVMVQLGGNWCVWCYRFHDFVEADSSLSSFLEENYVVLHVNFSPENRNEALLTQWEYPQRFGFPVFVVLDANGRRLHTQNSGYLELEKSYDTQTVKGFFRDWTATSLDPASYQK